MLNFWNTYKAQISIILLFIGVVTPTLFSEGMFMDGALYSTISMNLAKGKGDFFNLTLTNGMGKVFQGHPPLAMWIQQWFIKAFNYSQLGERMYSLFTHLGVFYLIHLLWRESKDENKYSWISMLFWITTPLVIWAVSNNILENTMIVFTTLAVYWIIKALKQNQLQFAVLGGLTTILAILTKGPTGLFPLATPFLYFLIIRKDWKQSLTTQLVVLISFGLPLLVSYYSSESFYLMTNNYFNTQIVRSLTSIKTTSYRWFIIERYFLEILPMLILTGIFLFIAKRKAIQLHFSKISIVYILISLSAVLPIMVSEKQSGIYMYGSLPFIAIALANFCYPLFKEWNNSNFTFRLKDKLPQINSALLILVLALSIHFSNQVGRDHKLIQDVHSIADITRKDLVANSHLMKQYSAQIYLQRYYDFAWVYTRMDHEYYICKKGTQSIETKKLEKVDLQLHYFDIYKY